jgi:hypothetical protein
VTTTLLSFVDVVVIADLKQFEFDHVIVALTQAQSDLATLLELYVSQVVFVPLLLWLYMNILKN